MTANSHYIRLSKHIITPLCDYDIRLASARCKSTESHGGISMAICQKCGAALENTAKFCHICGAPVSSDEQQVSEKHLSDYNSEQPRQPSCSMEPDVPPPFPIEPQNQHCHQNHQYYAYANLAKRNMGYPLPFSSGAENAKITFYPTIKDIFSKSFAFIIKKPILLWGLSLLYILLSLLAIVLAVLPIISIPIILVLSVGMTSVFLESYRGNEISSNQLFAGFKNFFHFCGGMAWMLLWIFIWGLIPAAGIVFAVIKAYSYRFVPYILLAQPDISPFDALRESMKQTKGYCGRMFCADIIIVACIAGALLFFYLFSYIPLMGIIFKTIYFLLAAAALLLSPLVFGVVQAVFYDEISKINAENDEQVK
jgi:uncharacterized membrane protein